MTGKQKEQLIAELSQAHHDLQENMEELLVRFADIAELRTQLVTKIEKFKHSLIQALAQNFSLPPEQSSQPPVED